MSKNLKKVDSSNSHNSLPAYKRSVVSQSPVRNGRSGMSGQGSNVLLSFALVRNVFTMLGIFGLVAFIAYWMIPWKQISSRFEVLTDFSYVPDEIDPVIYGSFVSSAPVFPNSFVDSQSERGSASVVFSVQSGDSLKSLLLRYGLSSDEASSAHQGLVSLKKDRGLKNVIRAEDRLEGELSSDGTLKSVRIKLSADEHVYLAPDAMGVFTPSIAKIDKKLKERIVVGTIQSSFAAAARQAGLGYDVVDDLVDIFSDRISFHRDFRKGDRFSLIYQEHEHIDEGSVSSGPIIAAALEIKGKHFTAVRYVGADGKMRYFNEDGNLIGNTFLRYPVKFSRISSQFSDGRFHPVLKIKRPHHGVDFAAPTGTPVRTVGDGVVTFAGRKGGHGIIIEIKHSDRYTTGYSHLSAISPGIKSGTRVSRGTVIGKVGMTGLATGPHLHFSLYDKGVYVDPLKAKLPQSEDLRPGIKISPTYLSRARYTLEHYQTLADSNILQN
jgi:murein DD-endopeptidase MepM/ murein hydrolase activator NlpD